MCGIAGYIGDQEISKRSIQETLKIMDHRGPDAQGFKQVRGPHQNGLLLHTRLAIVDLDRRSSQPFVDQENILVFNGEIYNFIEIRRSLIALGHTFKTSGDTEVLAVALRQWGKGALNRLEGMWAFIWYQGCTKTFLVSRDRFGEKPLFMTEGNNGVYFASEVKALITFSNETPELNHSHMFRYLVNGYKSIHKTNDNFFQNVSEVEPGSCIEFQYNRRPIYTRYWNRLIAEDPSLTRDDAILRVREAFLESMKLRLRSDVPLAFCLSGGVDSNSIIATARKVFDQECHAFTLMNKDQRYDEGETVEAVVEELDVRHTKVFFEQEDFIENLKTLVDARMAPISTITYYVHWLLMRSISRAGYKVVFSGTGADELFSGYYDHHNLYLAEIYNTKSLYQDAKKSWVNGVGKFVRNPFLKDPDLFIKRPDFRDHIYLDSSYFASFLKKPWCEEFVEKKYVKSLLRNRMMNELFEEAVPVILHEDDINAMYFSMENRSPFLDRTLYETAYSIPTNLLIKDGFAKSILRDAMSGIVPRVVLQNPQKIGFNAPLLDALNLNHNKEFLLDGGKIFDFVKKEKVEELVKEDRLPNSQSKFLFNFINIKLLMEAM